MRDHRRNIQNQHDGAVAKNGSAADERRGDEFVLERFDDQFFFAHQAIHGEAKAAAAGANDDDENAVGVILSLTRRSEAFEANQRENLLAELEDLVIVHAMNRRRFGDARDFDDGSDRHGIEASR